MSIPSRATLKALADAKEAAPPIPPLMVREADGSIRRFTDRDCLCVAFRILAQLPLFVGPRQAPLTQAEYDQLRADFATVCSYLEHGA